MADNSEFFRHNSALSDIAKHAKLTDELLNSPAARGLRDFDKTQELMRNAVMPPMLGHLGTDHLAMDHFESIQRTIAEAREAPTARRAVLNLMGEIQEFEAQLEESSEVGVRLVSFGNAVVVHVREIGCRQPNLVVFHGALEDGQPVRLIQHLSQLSFLLMSVPRLNPEEPRRRIGFSFGEEADEPEE